MKAFRSFVMFLMVASMVACGGPTATTPTQEVSRIEVTPDGFLFTTAGEHQLLQAQAYDERGRPVEASFIWTSSHPNVISVTPDGLITSVADLGSAQITVSFDGTESVPVLVLVAQPASEAVLYTQANLVGGATLQSLNVSTTTPFEVGDRYSVTLTGLPALVVGAILLPRDDSPYVGRVVNVTESENDVQVTLEVIALFDAFESLELEQTLYLDGSMHETYNISEVGVSATRSLGSVSFEGELVEYAFAPLANESEFFKVPPLFRCVAQMNDSFPLAPSFMETKLDLPIRADILFRKVNGKQETRLKATVNAKAIITGGLKLKAAISGKVTCSLQRNVPIPVGPIAAIVQPEVPAGLFLEMGGEFSLTGFEAGVKGELKTTKPFVLGFECLHEQACENLSSLPEFDAGVTPSVVFPGEQNFRVTGNVLVGGKSGLTASNTLASLLSELLVDRPARVEVIDVTSGFKQSLELGTLNDQASNADFAANYKLGFEVNIAPGSDVKKVIKLIFGSEKALDLSITPLNLELFTSPKGSLVVQEDTWEAGDTVHFNVTTDPETITYLGIYNIDEVRVYRKTAGGLESSPVVTQAATNGQSSFNLSWVASTTGSATDPQGNSNFVAFVMTDLLPFAPLKLASDICIAPNAQPRLESGAARLLDSQCPPNVTVLTSKGFVYAIAAVSFPNIAEEDRDEFEGFDAYTRNIAIEASIENVRASFEGDISYELFFDATSGSLTGFSGLTRFLAQRTKTDDFGAYTARGESSVDMEIEVHHTPVLLRFDAMAEIVAPFEHGPVSFLLVDLDARERLISYFTFEGGSVSEAATLPPGRYRLSTASVNDLFDADLADDAGSLSALVGWAFDITLEPALEE